MSSRPYGANRRHVDVCEGDEECPLCHRSAGVNVVEYQEARDLIEEDVEAFVDSLGLVCPICHTEGVHALDCPIIKLQEAVRHG